LRARLTAGRLLIACLRVRDVCSERERKRARCR
jgi:hypothetical protein